MAEPTASPPNDAAAPDRGDQIAALLRELSGAQGELLSLLSRKRELVVNKDSAGLNQLHQEEKKLVQQLKQCCQQRQQLLDEAGAEGLPAGSLRQLTATLPRDQRGELQHDLQDARRQARLLQHQSLANWVLVQRSLLHLSQMMEIIATGGRMQPTYGKQSDALSGGALVDQAV